MRAHLASLVHEFRQHAAQTAVVAHRGNRSYRSTYGEVAQLAGRFAAELDRRNILPGDRIILWGTNSANWIAAFFGCLLRGVIAVPLDAAGIPAFAQRILNDVAPKLIVADEPLLASLKTNIPQLHLATLTNHLPTQPNFTISPAVNNQTPFQIIFTSGTTSDPKGIVHTHRNVLASLQPIEDEITKYRHYERIVHPLRFLHTLPLSHVFGQFMGLWIPPLLAAEVHFVDQLEARRTIHLIHHERISVLIAVPRVLHLLRAHLLSQFNLTPEKLEQASSLSPLKRWWQFRSVHRTLGWKFWAIISGGATLPADLERFWNQLGLALIQGYGMTETAALITLNHPFRVAHGTIGKALPGREIRLSSEGEILVRGEMLATSTWQNGAMYPREGEWLATGDLAAESNSGELRFLGRRNDVIVTAAGMNIHPADLEAALATQPNIRGSVVIPCEFAGSAEPVAVVLSSASDEELQTAVTNANRTLASHQQIRRVLKWPQLQFPYTSTGKLLRREVTQWACHTILNQQSQRSTSAGGDEDILLKLIATVTGEPIPHSNNNLRLSEDLHLDSLGRVQLQSELEQQLQLELNDDAVANAITLHDLRQLIQRETSCSIAKPPSAALPNEAPTIAAHISVTNPELTAPSHIYPRWPWSWPIKAARIAFIEIIMRPLVRLLAAPRVTHPPTPLPQGPLLIITNHATAYDGALLLYALPPRLRHQTATAMSGEMLFDLRHGQNQPSAILNLLAPAGYWLITALFNVFPLPRLRGFQRSFEHAGEAMDKGYSVLIFPEGTRSPDAKLHPFRPGIGLLAQDSRVPILPVALIGLDRMKKSGWLRSGQLEIHLGEVIPVDEHSTPAELTQKFEDSIRHLGCL
ncbi:AMP-binding protein [Edaphobacter dinghuensis]|uniref:AMP-binding protein n=1 Tax=Edaphobacter dinghuensis TaxID=1560005 RepID=A0A917H8X6_9BACT|nr:AMP-binding protein [Edaphobacter dinghuensis]GGG71379.1 AMP-binding protein [Edaphobacter dinghuensis]